MKYLVVAAWLVLHGTAFILTRRQSAEERAKREQYWLDGFIQ
jgi:hypothetical protein